MRLLLVEDNVALADSLNTVLKRAGYAVDWRTDGRDAALLGEQEPYDLAILDLGLPGLDGLEVLRRWRTAGSTLPVLILTARSRWTERVEGLQAGADDLANQQQSAQQLHIILKRLVITYYDPRLAELKMVWPSLLRKKKWAV